VARYYLRVPGVMGDARDAAHKRWIEIDGFNAPQAPANDRETDDPKPKRTLTVTVMKQPDSASDKLRAAQRNATHFDMIAIDTVSDPGSSRLTFDSVYVASVEQSAYGPPLETITFVYENVVFEAPTAAADAPARPAPRDEPGPSPGRGRERLETAPASQKKPVYVRPVVRSSAETAPVVYSKLVLPFNRLYSLRGETLSRIAYAADAQDAAMIDRHAEPARERVLPLRGVQIELREAGTDPDTDPAYADVVTGDDGGFEFVNLLEEGKEYELTAYLHHTEQRLKEERVTVTGIRVDRLPQNDSSTPVTVRHRNHAAGSEYVADETEELRAPLEPRASGESVLSLTGANALLFNTLMLNTPYINQNRNPNNTQKVVNIDGIGGVSGGILCFPTSMAMAVSHFRAAGAPATTDSVATAAYRNWQGAHFPHRVGTTGPERYRFNYGNGSGQNIWEWWLWENRAARQLVGLPLAQNWHPYENDVDGLESLPAAGHWQTHWGELNPFAPTSAPYVRRQMGRGWPLVVGTNLTTAGHIIIARGVVIRNDGTLHKLIVNNPWGEPGPNEARALYHDSRTPAAGGQRLRIANHFVLRRGVAREAVLRDLIVHGQGVGVSSTSRPTGAPPPGLEPVMI